MGKSLADHKHYPYSKFFYITYFSLVRVIFTFAVLLTIEGFNDVIIAVGYCLPTLGGLAMFTLLRMFDCYVEQFKVALMQCCLVALAGINLMDQTVNKSNHIIGTVFVVTFTAIQAVTFVITLGQAVVKFVLNVVKCLRRKR